MSSEAVRAMALDGFPQSTHINMCAGPRAKYGLPSPSSRRIEKSDPIVVGFGLMGALNCRAGFMVGHARELPTQIQDYVEKLVGPYFDAAAAWYETIGIGVEGGAVTTPSWPASVIRSLASALIPATSFISMNG